MAQYTNTQTAENGNVVTAVFDTEANTITFTVVTPKGTTVTNTQSADYSFNKSQGGSLLALSAPLIAAGERASLTLALSDTYNAVKREAKLAAEGVPPTTTDPAKETPKPEPAPTPPEPKPEPPVPAPPEPLVDEYGNPVSDAQLTQATLNEAPPVEDADTAAEEADNQARVEAAFDQDIRDQVAVEDVDPAAEEADNQARVEAAAAADVQATAPPGEASYTPPSAEMKAKHAAESYANSLITATPDWRVRLSLASSASYLYNDAKDETHILFPLKATNGVIFPYTPTIQSSYKANYDASDLTHANYKQYFYKNSSVEEISITADFTAQDNTEAKYLLATIHFFKSVTKMFYGKDTDPAPGTPPPLCFLNGYGTYQYNQHPLLITNFQYTLPNDVDYVRTIGTALGTASSSGASVSTKQKAGSFLDSLKSAGQSVVDRLKGNNLNKGAVNPGPTFNNLAAPGATYVPSKIQITISAIPIVTRGDISNNFSVKDYASGKLLKGNAF